ncbi:putative wall-associated receptor kinase-like 16 [Cotesia glomerata]|uniref:putative wall-associated receptor kinase-like 16 n=1 Tax=Cotesia glomerata TaxID=32391 RepID=UPI001D024827|nr:putative wall-associated receptor kinase-like 16 [Cotesia glomerata]
MESIELALSAIALMTVKPFLRGMRTEITETGKIWILAVKYSSRSKIPLCFLVQELKVSSGKDFGKIQCAVKMISLSKSNCISISREICVSQSVDHPNVIKTLGICVETNRLFITMELFTGTTLMNYIFNEYNINCEKLTTDMKHAIGRQICLSINYLHTRANPVIHGDIKPSNILVNPQMVVKVCDMGLSRFAHVTKSLVSTMHHQAQSPKRTLMYMAPEILKNKLPTIKSEVWSLACTLVELYQESSIWEVRFSLAALIRNLRVPPSYGLC